MFTSVFTGKSGERAALARPETRGRNWLPASTGSEAAPFPEYGISGQPE
jgi:hypothetical protein